MKRKKRESREEVINDLLRTDPNFRALKEAIERRGGTAPMTAADSEELWRRVEARIVQLRDRESS